MGTWADDKHEFCNKFDLRKPLERQFLSGKNIDCVSIQDSPDLVALQNRCATFLSQFPRFDLWLLVYVSCFRYANVNSVTRDIYIPWNPKVRRGIYSSFPILHLYLTKNFTLFLQHLQKWWKYLSWSNCHSVTVRSTMCTFQHGRWKIKFAPKPLVYLIMLVICKKSSFFCYVVIVPLMINCIYYTSSISWTFTVILLSWLRNLSFQHYQMVQV